MEDRYNKKNRYSGLLVLALLFLVSITVNAQKFKENFVDSTDNALDISKWLSQVYRITEVWWNWSHNVNPF